MCPPGVANGNQAAQQQQLVFGGNAVQPVQQVIAGAQQIAQQQAAQQPQQPQPQQQPQQPAQPAAQPPQQAPQPAQPGNGAAAQASAAHASARQAVADWGFAQPEVKASAAWQEALRKFAAAGPVIVTLGAVRRTLGPVHQRIRDAGNSHLLLVEDLYTLGPFRLSDLDGLPDETLVVIGPSTGRHYPVSAEWSLAVASETGRSWLDVYFGQRRVAMTGASTGMKSAAMWEGKDGLVGGLPFLSPSYDTYPVAAPGSKHNVFDLTDAEHRRINAAQMVGLEELGERIWEPTGAATLKAQLFYLSRGNMDNVVKGMIQVPGLPFPLPIALVLRDGEVHTVFHSMHETMAVHAECRFAVAGPALAAHAVAMGTPADAGALLRLLGAYGELFDPVDKALHSLPHLFGEASSGLRDTMQALADANAELPRVEAATSAAGGAGEQLFSAGKPVLGHACQLAMQLQEALVALKQMGKVDCAGLVPMAYAQAADRSFTLLAAWAAEAAPRRGGLLAHMRGGSSSGGSTSGSIPAPALPLETAAAAGAGGAAGTAGAAGAAPAADDEAARSFDQRFQLASQGRPALGRPARKSQDVLKQLDKLQRCGDEYVKQQRAAAPRGGTSGQRQQAAPRSRRSSGSGGGSGSGGRKRQQQRDHAGGTMLVPPPVAFGASAAAGAAAAAAGASRKRSHDSLAEDLLDAPEELSAAAAATAAGAPPAAPPAAPQPQRRIKRAKDSSRPVSGMAVTAGDARRAELRAVMTAVAGTHGDEDADSKLLQAVKAAYEVDPRRSSDSEALQRAARFAAIQAAVRATATGDGIGQKATCAAKAVEAGQMYAWLTPSLIEVFRPAYVKSSAKSGKEFVALLLKDPQLVQLLQAATQREKEQALALGGLLRLSQPLSLFFCEDELLWKNSRGDDGRFRGWLNNTMPKKTGKVAAAAAAAQEAAAPEAAASDAEVVAVAQRAFAADPRSRSSSEADRLAAAAVAAGCAARAAGANSKESDAVERVVRSKQMSPYLLLGAMADLLAVLRSSAAKTGEQLATVMLQGSGPERELLLRLQQRERQLEAGLRAALHLPQPLAPILCDKELQGGGRGLNGRLRLLFANRYRYDSAWREAAAGTEADEEEGRETADEEEEDEEAATRRSARGGSKNRTSQGVRRTGRQQAHVSHHLEEESEEPSSTSEEEEDSSSGSEDEEEEEEEEAPAQRRASRRSTQTRAPQGVRRTGRQRAQVNYNVDAIEDDSEDLETSSCEEESEEEQEGRRRRRPTRRAAKVDEEEEE